MRLAATRKAGFYPTPSSVIDTLKTYIRPAPPNLAGGGYQILDPCCGKGTALAGLAESLPGCCSYGNELDTKRAEQAAKCLNVAVCGAMEFLRVEGQFGMCLLNPPYTEGESGERQEVEFLDLATPWIAPGGLLIYIVPQKIIDVYGTLDKLTSWYDNLLVRKFPEGEYERFNQVVIFGIKRAERLSHTYGALNTFRRENMVDGEFRLKDLTPNEFSFSIPITPTVERFEATVPNLVAAIEEASASGAMTTDKWKLVMTGGQRGVGKFQPLMQMKPGHVALLTAAGFANGMRLDGNQLVKGCVERYIETETEQQGDTKIVVEKQRQAAILVTLDLTTCEVKRYDSRQKERYEKFLSEHVDVLTRGIQEQYQPLYEMGLNGWKDLIPTIRAPGKLPGHEGNGLLPAQQHVVAALGQRLRTEKAVGIVGEMGVGKTLVSIALKTLMNAYRLQANPDKKVKVVVLCPNHLPPKWKREIEKAGREYKAKAVICRSVSDVERAMNMPGLTFLIISEQKAKHTNRWEHRYITRRELVVRQEKYYEKEEVESPYGSTYTRNVEKHRTIREIVDFIACPDCGEFFEDGDGRRMRAGSELFESKKKHKCPFCEGAMWARVPYKTVQRYALATYLNRRYAGKYHLIVDECHQYKSATAARAQAFQSLAATSISMIVMTGTLYGGRAPSIFHLLHRTLPAFRELYAFDDVSKFTEHYGLIETRTKTTQLERWHSVHGYTKTSKSTRVLPGAHPGMVALLLPHFAFLNLADLGVDLPPYTEQRLPVEVSDSLLEGYAVIEKYGEEAKRKAARGDMSYLAAYLQAALGWLDCPKMEILETRDEDFEIPGIEPDEDGLYPKDRKLIELIESEIAQERGVGVFFQQVRKRDPMPRIQKALQECGIDARILRQKVKPEQREEWYRKAIAGGMQVLLCNGNLVGMGLDLVELPTLVEFQHEYSLYNLRQRDRRSWRLGQTKPVKIVFLYYENTMQEQALRLVAEKLRAAQMLDGETIEGLSSFGQTPDIHAELMATVIGDVPPREWQMGAVEIKPVPEKMVVRAAVELYESGGVKSSSIALVPAEPEKKKPFVANEYSQMGLGI